ncbi:hypothetical protein [Maribacter sp. 2308TA10-17]|uniref:hypothetical protein n=1 Tax=Maribacter sp. 2308TA10-17 TaxID=3386276 RepID=UPI0039BD094E
MKALLKITVLLLVLSTFYNCSKDDNTPVPEPIAQPQPMPEPEPENQAPTQVSLVSPAPDTENIDVRPTFSWQAATDPDGDTITYEVYADTTAAPSTLIGTTNATSFEMEERLNLLENYNWKIVANDGKGGESESESQSFDTRNVFFSNATQNADFLGRSAFASTVFQDKVWISGGFQDATLELGRTNDIWNSEDGVNWVLVTQNAEWPGRIRHEMIVFDNKLWIIGGFDSEGPIGDVWNSEDGVTWNLVTDSAGFGNVSGHSVIVFDDKMWLTQEGAVWFSDNGAVWTLASDDGIGQLRIRHTSVVFEDKMWVIGGANEGANNVMSSNDGITWVVVNDAPSFIDENSFERRGHTSVVFDDKIWVIAGFGGKVEATDIWYSKDGKDWLLSTEESAYSGRVSHESVVYNNKIWVIGGQDVITNDRKNDVWFID